MESKKIKKLNDEQIAQVTGGSGFPEIGGINTDGGSGGSGAGAGIGGSGVNGGAGGNNGGDSSDIAGTGGRLPDTHNGLSGGSGNV